jgi:hypothetical protein
MIPLNEIVGSLSIIYILKSDIKTLQAHDILIPMKVRLHPTLIK